jgi:hypothetical protein
MATWIEQNASYLESPSTEAFRDQLNKIAQDQIQTLGNLQPQVGALEQTLAPIEFGVGAATSSMATVYSGVAADVLQQEPEISVISFDRTREQDELDHRLRDLSGDPTLGERRRGAWQTYKRGTREARIQACHTLREILTHLLDNYATSKAVQGAVWWKPPKEGKPTKRQKIRFFMIGREGWDEEPEYTLIEEQVETAIDQHDAAIRVAHDKEDLSPDACRERMNALEGAILNLLRARQHVAYLRALRGYP